MIDATFVSRQNKNSPTPENQKLDQELNTSFFATEFFIQKFGIKKSLGSKFAWVNLNF